jgi:hypothetical protein
VKRALNFLAELYSAGSLHHDTEPPGSTSKDVQLERNIAQDDQSVVSQQSRAIILMTQLREHLAAKYSPTDDGQMVQIETKAKEKDLIHGGDQSKKLSQLQSNNVGGLQVSTENCKKASQDSGNSVQKGSGSHWPKGILSGHNGDDSIKDIEELIDDIKKSQSKKKDEEADKLKRELETLKTVISFRNQSSSKFESEIMFTGSIDDDEVLLHAFLKGCQKKGGNRAQKKLEYRIPRDQLIKRLFADDQAVGKVIMRSWTIDLDGFQDALSSVSHFHSGDKEKRNEKAKIGVEKNMLKDIFMRILPSSKSMTEGATADRRDIERYLSIDEDSLSCDLKAAIQGIAAGLYYPDEPVTFQNLREMMSRVSRLSGPRIHWVKELGLNKALARHLKPGTIEDGLKGIREMSDLELDAALEAFFKDVKQKIKKKKDDLNQSNSLDAVQANSKFAGFVGSFGPIEEFYQGASETLQLAYPNPDFMKGIEEEHTMHPSATRFFVTSNYQICTCLLLEYWWATNPHNFPTEVEGILFSLAKNHGIEENWRKDPYQLTTPFPGEEGDRYCESYVFFDVQFCDRAYHDAAHVGTEGEPSYPDQNQENQLAKDSVSHPDLHLENKINIQNLTSKLFDTPSDKADKHVLHGERKARGVSILGHKQCEDLLAHSKGGKSYSTLVGFVLPMLPSEAYTHVEDLKGAVANVVDVNDSYKINIYDAGLRNDHTEISPLYFKNEVWSKTFIYCKYPGIPELQKHLGDLSPVRLWDEAEASWGVTSCRSGESLIQAIVDSYVRYELSVDFEASLEFANKAKLEDLYKALLLDTSGIKQKLEPKQLVALLDSEEQWDKVKHWVARFRKRIQGRSKKGYAELLEQKKQKINECKLLKEELLGVYLYTGPCFVAYNGIYRKFPQTIMDLLEGEGDTARNTMATTLFCISSALMKLGRHTKLPENGKVYRGLGAMHLPHQFWVARGNPAWKGGVERAVMSTTTDKDIAIFYSSLSGKGIVAEISVGRVQMGGDMSWISMVRNFC